MKCWFCEKDAKGACAACGRGLCTEHAHFHDEMTLSKSDTSTGYASFYNVYNALKCSDCRLQWINFDRIADVVVARPHREFDPHPALRATLSQWERE